MAAWPIAIAATFAAITLLLWRARHRIMAAGFGLLGAAIAGMCAFVWLFGILGGQLLNDSSGMLSLIGPTGSLPALGWVLRVVADPVFWRMQSLHAASPFVLALFIGEGVLLAGLWFAHSSLSDALRLGHLRLPERRSA